ncbi:MAG: hypothetical protein ACSHXY_05015 [Alphaproteobacteria bacterium]
MKDWQFYPIITAAIAALILYALSFAEYGNGPSGNNFVIKGPSLNTLYAAEGVSFSIAGDPSNPSAYAVMSAHVSRANAPPSAGVFATLGPADEKRFAGQKLNITVRARTGRATPLASFDVGYFTAGAGDSGWKTFSLTDEFEDYSFTFTPGLPKGDPGNDYIGIWPDVEGKSLTVDVKSITVDITTPE